MHRISRGRSLSRSSTIPRQHIFQPSHGRQFWSRASSTPLPTSPSSPLIPSHILSRLRILISDPTFTSQILPSLLFAKVPRGFGPYFEGGDSKPPKPSAQPAKPKSPETSSSSSSSSEQSSSSSSSAPHAAASSDTKEKNDDEQPKKETPKEDKNKDDKNDDEDEESKNRRGPFGDPMMLWLLFPLALFMFGPNVSMRTNENEVSFQQFRIHMLERGVVHHIEVVNKQTARIYLRNDLDDSTETYSLDSNDPSSKPRSLYGKYQPGKIYSLEIGSVDSFEDRLEAAQFDMGIDPQDYVPVEYISEINVRNAFLEMITSGSFWMILVMLYLWRSFSRSASSIMGNLPGGGGRGGRGGIGGIFDVGKSNAKVLNKGEKVKTRFTDVAGLEHAKEEVMEFVDFLKDPEKYQNLGARTPKGALLCGPPGTGKTLLARAVAGEADCPFFSISGSDFVEMFVGVGPSRVRDLFEQARKNVPCIIFIDEIDAVGRKRGKGGWAGGNDERENTLNQLLVEMDGFKTDTNIVVLAGTNRADILDSALTRPGRLDRTIQIEKADIKGRIEIFKVHLKKLQLAQPIADVAQRLATLTPGFSGADIANVCNEGALRAARKNKTLVSMEDFHEACDRIIGGLEKKQVMSPQEKSLIAHHEAGHAVCGWFLEYADPLLKVTIVPRATGALGFAQYLPKELQLYTKDQLLDMMCMTMGGRASELMMFGRVSTGAADDLNKVTKLAYGIVQIYGMNDSMGNLSFPPDQYQDQPYRPVSEKTAEMVDAEARKLVEQAYERAQELLKDKREYVEKLGAYLLEHETVEHDALVEILGERPFQNDAYRNYMDNTREFAEKYGEETVLTPEQSRVTMASEGSEEGGEEQQQQEEQSETDSQENTTEESKKEN